MHRDHSLCLSIARIHPTLKCRYITARPLKCRYITARPLKCRYITARLPHTQYCFNKMHAAYGWLTKLNLQQTYADMQETNKQDFFHKPTWTAKEQLTNR